MIVRRARSSSFSLRRQCDAADCHRAKSALNRAHLPATQPQPTEPQPDTCVICMDQLESPQDARTLVCGHNAFHHHCVTRWLAQCPRCPLCAHPQSDFDIDDKEEQVDPYSRALPIDVTWSDEDDHLFFVQPPQNLTWQIHHRRVRHVVERPSTPRYRSRRKRGLFNSLFASSRK